MGCCFRGLLFLRSFVVARWSFCPRRPFAAKDRKRDTRRAAILRRCVVLDVESSRFSDFGGATRRPLKTHSFEDISDTDGASKSRCSFCLAVIESLLGAYGQKTYQGFIMLSLGAVSELKATAAAVCTPCCKTDATAVAVG